MGEEGIYCCAIYQFHQDSFRAAAVDARWAVGRSQGIVSEYHTRPPACRRPVAQAILLFIAAVLIILGVDQSMPALDCIYGPASTRVEINT